MKKVLLIILAILVVLLLAKNVIGKAVVTKGIKSLTGLRLKLNSMSVGITKSIVDIRGLKILNPPGFEQKVMADIPEIYVDYDLGAFLGGRAHFEKLRLHVSELVIIRNEQGKVNLDTLKEIHQKKGKAASKPKGGSPEFKIDVLELKIGKVVFRDYWRGMTPKMTEFDANIDERFENVTDAASFVNIIIARALAKTTIASLVDFHIVSPEKAIDRTLRKASDSAQGIVDNYLG